MIKKIKEKIIREYSNREKRSKKSIIDDIRGFKDERSEELLSLINIYKNKKDLSEKFIDIVPLYYDMSGLWWRWKEKNKRWQLTDEIEILNLINYCSGVNIITPKERIEIINSLKQQSRKIKPKDIKKTWIQFDDEIIDIETGERIPASSEYFITNPIPWHLGRTEETPMMDKIFEEWVGKKYVKTLYEIIAYCLLPDYPIHRLFCFIGEGLNGKSCFLKLLRKFVGNQNVCSTELDILMASRFEKTRLHKKLVCQMGETNFNEISKTSILKKLTGGDLIGFEYKNKNPFEEINYAKIIIATNNLPVTSDKTLGFYRRWLIIDFPNKFSEKKDILLDIPDEEYDNLGMKCITLLMELLEKRKFNEEGSVEERMEKYESKSDYLQKFLDEFINQEADGYIPKAEFYKKFSDWCIQERHRKMSENSLGKSMKKYGIESGRKYAEWLFDGKGGQMRIWVGVKWK